MYVYDINVGLNIGNTFSKTKNGDYGDRHSALALAFQNSVVSYVTSSMYIYVPTPPHPPMCLCVYVSDGDHT